MYAKIIENVTFGPIFICLLCSSLLLGAFASSAPLPSIITYLFPIFLFLFLFRQLDCWRLLRSNFRRGRIRRHSRSAVYRHTRVNGKWRLKTFINLSEGVSVLSRFGFHSRRRRLCQLMFTREKILDGKWTLIALSCDEILFLLVESWKSFSKSTSWFRSATLHREHNLKSVTWRAQDSDTIDIQHSHVSFSNCTIDNSRLNFEQIDFEWIFVCNNA